MIMDGRAKPYQNFRVEGEPNGAIGRCGHVNTDQAAGRNLTDKAGSIQATGSSDTGGTP